MIFSGKIVIVVVLMLVGIVSGATGTVGALISLLKKITTSVIPTTIITVRKYFILI
jgi:hypothetical protein